MKHSVYDTILVAKANGPLEGRRPGNALDRRLTLLEKALLQATETLVNGKLLGEYEKNITRVAVRNEVVRGFLEYVIDRGLDSGRSTLGGADFERAKKARWPKHDYHLLAAGIGRRGVSIFVTEKAHVACSGAILRQFGFRVVES